VIALGVWQARRDLSGLFRTGSLPLQIARSLLLLSNTACTFSGLRHLPLPVTTSLAMLAPLISTLLAALVLKDEVPMNSKRLGRFHPLVDLGSRRTDTHSIVNPTAATLSGQGCS